jgi:hypothetical protein
MKIDYKITTWESFEIDDEFKDDLLQFLKESPEPTAMEIFDWAVGMGIDPYVSQIVGSDSEMTPAENNNQSTVEVYDGEQLVFDNAISD